MSSELIKLTRDWAVVAAALLVAGPIAGAVADGLRTSSGLESASPLTASSPVTGVLVGLVVVAIAIAYGVAVGRFVHLRLGLICAGLVLTWPAWRFGTVAALIRDAGDASPISGLVMEGAIFAAVLSVGCLAIVRWARPVEDDVLQDQPLKKVATTEPARPADWAIGGAAAALAGAAAAWLIAQSPLQGQVYAAAVAAGVAGGAVGRSVAGRAPILAILIGGLCLAVVGPLVSQMALSGDALTRLYAGQWPGLGLITPFDWLAGVLVGAPLGEMWARSMVDRQTEPAARLSAARSA